VRFEEDSELRLRQASTAWTSFSFGMQLLSSSAAVAMHIRSHSHEDEENESIVLQEHYPDASSSGFTTPAAKSTASSLHTSDHDELPLADTDTGYAEGGFGWVVTACTFIICFHSLGFIYAWGVIQAQIEHDKILSATTAAWLGGVLAFVNAAVCPLGHVIIERFGPRNTCIASMSGMGITLIATSFTFKYPVALFIFQGFLYGTCSAITFIVSTHASQCLI
jgi:MFS family permease